MFKSACLLNMVLRVCSLLCVLFCFFLQACAHEDGEIGTQGVKKPNLSKAASYNVQLGLGYLKQGDRPRAKKKLLTALDQEPKSPDVHAAMAYYFEQTSELDQAKKYYLNALSLAGNTGSQFNNYGAFLCRQGDYKQAEYYFLKAAHELHYLHTAAAYENAGLCALSALKEQKARFYFSKALNQDPSRTVSFYELVQLEIKQGKDTEAFSLIQKHSDLIQNNRMLLVLAKNIAVKVGQKHLAGEYAISINKLDNRGVNNEYNNHSG